ncbi:MAG: BadF/BadG/BcrA/BcrD ATPase family protein, partial [Candidatus Thorarchaeota archaeon]
MGVGIDVGSTTTKGVLLDSSGKIVAKSLMLTGASAAQAVETTLQNITSRSGVNLNGLPVISTGYGRARVELAVKSITEITCHSVGVHHINPQIRLLIDVGGQDSKVIRIGPSGRPEDFELNDKCSAGTGR